MLNIRPAPITPPQIIRADCSLTEAHVEHLVGLVHHEVGDAEQVGRLHLDHVDHPTCQRGGITGHRSNVTGHRSQVTDQKSEVRRQIIVHKSQLLSKVAGQMSEVSRLNVTSQRVRCGLIVLQGLQFESISGQIYVHPPAVASMKHEEFMKRVTTPNLN